MLSEDPFDPNRYAEEFDRRLERLAAAQGDALLFLGALRAQWDLEMLNQPPPPPLVVRAGRWIGRHAATLRQRFVQNRRAPSGDFLSGLPAAGKVAKEDVVIVDAEYRVIDSGTPDTVFDRQEERLPWDR